jgi:hypothetical protein
MRNCLLGIIFGSVYTFVKNIVCGGGKVFPLFNGVKAVALFSEGTRFSNKIKIDKKI